AGQFAHAPQRQRSATGVELLPLDLPPAVELVLAVTAQLLEQGPVVAGEGGGEVAARLRRREGRHVGGDLPLELVLRGLQADLEGQRAETLEEGPEVLPRGGRVRVGPEEVRHTFTTHPGAGVSEVKIGRASCRERV